VYIYSNSLQFDHKTNMRDLTLVVSSDYFLYAFTSLPEVFRFEHVGRMYDSN